jgi:hypothetical protein
MKTLFSLAIMILMSATMTFAQSEKTLIKTLSVEGAIAAIELPGEVTLKNWESDYIRITATVSTGNYNEDFLKKLVSAGRYDIVSVNENGQMVINMPKTSKKVTLSNVTLIENFKFEIYVPYGVEVKTNSSSSAM